ncbi:transcription factor bHLH51-like [Tripterygium wilfordii]|uniref:transcription factor bHLH51-like n=1 Tax=Tripterygium wilfordii TaxID=458696 RepID=UPI0018F7ED5E|nr:transcription factor bHLH51-like [Tripterygium wilfordii]
MEEYCSHSGSNWVPWPIHPPQLSASTINSPFHATPSWSVPIQGTSEDLAASASNSHSQAEKRRRDRINAQLATLRKLIPRSDKVDKAALLGRVIDHVKDLRREASEISKALTIPTEVDEVAVDCDLDHDQEQQSTYIRASVCCDDRPELFEELIRALKGLRLTTVKADIASVGGRIKSILVLCNEDGGECVSPSTVKQSLLLALSRISSSSMPSCSFIRSKRQRFFLSSY